MQISETALNEVWVLEPTLHGDKRGYFLEAFRESYFADAYPGLRFVQDNESKSSRGTLRGLHYQLRFPQGKLVRAISGEIFDVAVDLRRSSPTFGQWVGEILSDSNRKQLWIPPGFGHGIYILSETALVAYKCSEYYHPEDDHSLAWNDPDLAISWPLVLDPPLLSEKDRVAKSFREAKLFE